MSSSNTHSSSSPKPTPRQLRYLRVLAEQTGSTFTPPTSSPQARRMIEEIKARKRTPHGDIRRERRELTRDMASHHGDAAQVKPEEISGHGSSATWAKAETHNSPRAVHQKQGTLAAAAPPDAPQKGEPHAHLCYRIGNERRLIVIQRIRGAIRVGDLPEGKGKRYLIADRLATCGELDTLLAHYTSQAQELGVIPASPAGLR